MTTSELGYVTIESGTLGISDSALRVTGGLNPDQWLQQIKDGKAIAVGTGGDGVFGIVVRETENTFDVLPEEGKRIACLATPLLIAIPSGNLCIADRALLDESSNDCLKYPIDPGIYECMIALCDNEEKEFFGFVLVLKKAEQLSAINNGILEIEQLG